MTPGAVLAEDGRLLMAIVEDALREMGEAPGAGAPAAGRPRTKDEEMMAQLAARSRALSHPDGRGAT